MLNFLGVMFMMVYVALFSSILALNTSRDVFEGIISNANDDIKTSELLEERNKMLYKNIEKSCLPENTEKILKLKSETENVIGLINSIKTELIQTVEGADSPVIDSTGLFNIKALKAKDETNKTTRIMRGSDGFSGQAVVLKERISEYLDFIKSLFQNKNTSDLDLLISTLDSEILYNEELIIQTWEDEYFPLGSYLIVTLGNLSSIEASIRIAEAEILYNFDE